MIIGTSHFQTVADAIDYYRPYGYAPADVRRKLAAGEIHTGRPAVMPGDIVSVISGEGRYQIERGE